MERTRADVEPGTEPNVSVVDDATPGDAVEEPPVEPAAPAETRARKRARRRRRIAVEWVVLVVGALAIALFLRAFLFQAFYIPSESMLPTLEVGDRVLVNKLSYRLHDVHRGDIVVFEAPPGQETATVKDLVKRVVGLPGETVEARDGNVYVDGRLLEEPYLPSETRTEDFPPTDVPPSSYFVMGDNRSASKDSRVFRAIPESSIVGRVFVRIWPLDRLGFL